MSRITACPSPDDLLRAELGELSVNRSAAVRTHADGCAVCRSTQAGLRQLTGDLADTSSSAADSDAFVARIEAVVRAQPRTAAVTWGTRPWWGRGRHAAVLAAAVALLVLVPAGLMVGRRWGGADDAAPPVAGTFATRGRPVAADAARAGAEVLLVRDGRLQPVDGRAVCGAGALAVRVTNLSGRALQVMAFGRDAAGEVHWLYPGYLDARTNPASVAVADGVKGRVLDEIVQPDTPAPGLMRFVTLLSSSPLTVKEVEARLTAAAPAASLARLFPGVLAREWTAVCEARR